jgi:hypothetical protein
LPNYLGPIPPANQKRTEPRPKYPQNGPIFRRKSVQPIYNPKARYLPISQKFPSRKCLNHSALQKSQNLRTDSMAGAISCAIDDVLPEDKINDTYLAFVVGYEADKNGERSSATARLII